jgi:hypothetical protein
MNTNKKSTPNFQEPPSRENVSCRLPSNPGLSVTVIATSERGTTAALNEARRLAKDLNAHITLLKMEVVPLRLPLDKSPVLLDITTKQQCSLVLQSSAREEDVTIRVCLCHDRDLSLRQILRRRALVVIGGRRHWWGGKEERLEQALRRQGHHIIFVDVDQQRDWRSSSGSPLSQSGAGQLHEQAGGAPPAFWGEDLR